MEKMDISEVYRNAKFETLKISFSNQKNISAVITSRLHLGHISIADVVLNCVNPNEKGLLLNPLKKTEKIVSLNPVSKYYDVKYIYDKNNESFASSINSSKLGQFPVPDSLILNKYKEYKEENFEVNFGKFYIDKGFLSKRFHCTERRISGLGATIMISNKKVFFVDFDTNETWIIPIMKSFDKKKNQFMINDDTLVVKYQLKKMSRSTFNANFKHLLAS